MMIVVSLSECLQDRLSGRALPTIEMIGNNAAGSYHRCVTKNLAGWTYLV